MSCKLTHDQMLRLVVVLDGSRPILSSFTNLHVICALYPSFFHTSTCARQVFDEMPQGLGCVLF